MLLCQKLCSEKGFCASRIFPFCTPYKKTVMMKATNLVSISLIPFPIDRERKQPIPFVCLSVINGSELSCSLTSACALQRWGYGKSSVCVFQARTAKLLFTCVPFWAYVGSSSCLKGVWSERLLVGLLQTSFDILSRSQCCY